MENYLKPIGYIAVGFLSMAILHSLTQCNRDEDFLKKSISKDEENIAYDYEGLKVASSNIEKILLEADADAIDRMILSQMNDFYSSPENAYNSEELQTIGNAFKKAKLTTITANFAEYTYSIDKVEYTLTMALDENNEWKIVKF